MATSTTTLTAASLGIEDDLKCATCLELFQDPHSLPCLHTFCLECIKRTINGSNTFKCPLCRAEHELSEEKAELLPVDQYAVQELLLRGLQQSEAITMRKCQTCGEQTSIAAWCEECNGVICQPCVTLHSKLAPLRRHGVVEKKENVSEDSLAKGSKIYLCCPKHAGENLKYVCTECSELVCAECYMTTHRYHKYSTAEEARHNLEIKMKELARLAVIKKTEFGDYLKKVKKVEDEAIECTEHMKSAVNKTFDVIAASVAASIEMQRSEALQSVSQGVKKIWSQKNIMEVRIAQVDSFIRFADHAHKCNTSTSYVAMATQAIKLIKQLKDVHGDKDTLDYKMVAIGEQSGENLHLSVPLDRAIKLGQPTLEFEPASGSLTMSPQGRLSITVSLKVQGLPIVLTEPHKRYNLEVKTRQNRSTVCISVNLLQSQGLSWEVVAQSSTGAYCGNKLTIWCSMAGNMGIKPIERTYTINKTLAQPPQSVPHSDSESLNADVSGRTLQQVTKCLRIGTAQQQQVPNQRSQSNFKLAPSARNPPIAGSAQPIARIGARERGGPGDAMANVATQGTLTLQQLASAEPHQRKHIIGEHLYRKICNMYPQLAGKITGMLLEMDNSELLHMLEAPESLKAKVDEAVAVLQENQNKAVINPTMQMAAETA